MEMKRRALEKCDTPETTPAPYQPTVEVLAFQVSAAECWTIPVPDRETVAGDPVALLTMEMLPFMVPAAVGLNWTLRVRFCDRVSVTGALPPVIE